MKLSSDIHVNLGSFRLDLAFEVEGGERLGLLGRSGSGKSMTLKSIAGIVRPDSGRIVLGERTLFDSEKKINLPSRERRVGYLFQSYALFDKMTVLENLKIGMKDKKQAAKTEEFLTLFQIGDLQKRYPHQLSGGQQQRVALARMMLSEPDLLMLDEPFSALDQELKDEIDTPFLEMLSRFAGPVIFVSHNPLEIERYCTRILRIADGREI